MVLFNWFYVKNTFKIFLYCFADLKKNFNEFREFKITEIFFINGQNHEK